MSVTFNDIKAMLASCPEIATPHEELCHGVVQYLEKNKITLTPQWLESLRALSVLGSVQWPQLAHPRVALYASGYGRDDASVREKLHQVAQQQAPMTQLCALLDADLRVYELDLDVAVPTTGLQETEACHALSYGLMAVEEHVDGLMIGSLSDGAQEAMARAQDMLQKDDALCAFTALQQAACGTDVFAMLGAVCAARMAKIPVFVTGASATFWRLMASRLLPHDVLSHCVELPENLVADDVTTTLAAVQSLRFVLALVPAQNKTVKPVMPADAA